jgi:hypothetical protein
MERSLWRLARAMMGRGARIRMDEPSFEIFYERLFDHVIQLISSFQIELEFDRGAYALE